MFDGVKSRRRRRKTPSKKRVHNYKYTRTPKLLAECAGKKKKVCRSDPNCTVTKSGCRKRRSIVQKYYGPTLPNEDYSDSEYSDSDSVDSGKNKRSHKHKSKNVKRKSRRRRSSKSKKSKKVLGCGCSKNCKCRTKKRRRKSKSKSKRKH